MADGPVTIADVAAAAGVSVATVSKVINDRYGVAEQTSARVREVIEQLGYTSSLVAQSDVRGLLADAELCGIDESEEPTYRD